MATIDANRLPSAKAELAGLRHHFVAQIKLEEIERHRMRRTKGYNPKRRIAPKDMLSRERLDVLSATVLYGGNPEHKRSPGDYGLIPAIQPRPGKTLCDAQIMKTEALLLLQAGLRKGMVSICAEDEWPQNVWAVAETGEAFELQLENPEQGVYHGYPMPIDDDFRMVVIREWKNR